MLTRTAPFAAVIQKVQAGEADASQLRQLAQALVEAPNAATVLAQHSAGKILLDGIQATQQREVVAKLRAAVEDPATREPTIQRILEEAWWIFGGRFIDKAQRRNLTVLNQVDIPLIRADGVLQVVELKTANIPDLVVKYRNHYIVGPKVNEAVGQVTNYLRDFDEQRHIIEENFGIECRRAFATVLIGHPRYVRDVTAEEVTKALRTYNAHLSRIEVITYGELIAGAEGALSLHDRQEELEPEQSEWDAPWEGASF